MRQPPMNRATNRAMHKATSLAVVIILTLSVDAQTRVTTTVTGQTAVPTSAVATSSTTNVTVSPATSSAANAAYHPSRVLVSFRDSAPKDLLPGSGPVRTFPGNPKLLLVDNPPGLSVVDAVGRYKNNPNVEYAEPDYVVNAVGIVPSDPLFSQQWDMTKISADIAWQTQTDASDVVAVIIDTGIDYTHPDLRANLWVNPAGGSSHGFTCIGGACVAGGQDDYGPRATTASASPESIGRSSYCRSSSWMPTARGKSPMQSWHFNRCCN
jgi:subtilisin family serine protease